MIRLIGYEFGKIVKRRIVLVSLAFLTVLAAMLYMENGPQSVICLMPDGRYLGGREAIVWEKQMASEYKGDLTEEKVREILEKYTPDAEDEMRGVWTVNAVYNAIQHSFGNLDGSYNGLNVEEAFPDYEGETSLRLGYSEGYAGFINMGMSLMVGLGFVLVICLAPVFAEEYSRKTDALILVSRYGKNRCALAKILAAYLLALLVTGIIFSTMTGLFLGAFGWTGGESSIQINSRYLLQNVPYFMTCKEAVRDSMVLWIAGILLLTALILLLSVLCRTSFITLIAALAVYTLPMAGLNLHIPKEILSFTPFWCFLSENTLTIAKAFNGELSWIWGPFLLAVVCVPAVMYFGQKVFAGHEST